MAIILGSLNAHLLDDGKVEVCCTSQSSILLRAMLAKNLDTAEWDFVRSYG
jgi:hypothetical protein